jgi:hypothetical protein
MFGILKASPVRAAAAVFLCGLFAGATALAGDRASGKFSSPKWNVPILDAYAFHGKGGVGIDEDRVLVAVSNRGMDAAWIDKYYDRRNYLSSYFADEKTKIAFFEFDLDGTYRAYSFFFESGDNCGYCGGGPVQSSVELKNGKLEGKLHLDAEGENQKFDIVLNVPVATDDHGEKQGPGGGAPGKAYIAYHLANVKGDIRAMKKYSSAFVLAQWAKAKKAGEEKDYIRFLTEHRPITARVTEAFVKGDDALVLVSGESRILGKMHGEAALVREKGQWKVRDETLEMGEK